MTLLRDRKIAKITASFMMLLVVCMSLPLGVFADTLSVDLKANGQSAITLATSTDAFTLNLATVGATACQMASPTASGVSSTLSSNIAPGHPWYPVIGGSTTFTVTCTDGVNNQSSTAVVSLPLATVSAPLTVSADIKVNGSDGPVTLTSGAAYTYTWTSTNATACQLTSPSASGISTSGTSASVTSGHSWYPSVSTPTTLTITCTDGVNNITDSVTVGLAGSGPGAPAVVTADIKANGSDGPVVIIAPGSNFIYTWTSTNATACQLTSPTASGISTSGTSATITPTHPWYPVAASRTTLTLVCTDGVNNSTDNVAVVLGTTGGGSTVSVDVKINGSDGPVSITNGTNWTYSWTSVNATACQMTSPTASGVAISGTSATIAPGHPWYPAIGGSTTISITCTDGVNNASDQAVISVTNPGGSTPNTPNSPNSPNSPNNPSGPACLYVRDYMRMDFQNDPIEVMKLQAFLKVFEGYDVAITGTFDQATFNAVSAFQAKYQGDILDPWALKGPTGYVYILTLKKINEIYCLKIFPLNEAQAQEILAYRALVIGLRSQGISVDSPIVGTKTIINTVETASCAMCPCACDGVVGTNIATSSSIITSGTSTSTTTSSQGQNQSKLASVLFATPHTGMDALQCIYEFLLILIVLYILGSVLEDVLYKKEDLTKVHARFYTKWATVALGLVVAMVVAYLVNEWCLMLPLLIALIVSLVWMALYPKHTALQTDARRLYLTTSTRAKSVFQKKAPLPAVIVLEEKKD